jgi:hypothetical protein
MPQPQNTMPAAAPLRKSRRVVMHSSLVVFFFIAASVRQPRPMPQGANPDLTPAFLTSR